MRSYLSYLFIQLSKMYCSPTPPPGKRRKNVGLSNILDSELDRGKDSGEVSWVSCWSGGYGQRAALRNHPENRSIPVTRKTRQLKREEPHDKIEVHLAGCNNPIKPEVQDELYTEQQDSTSHREKFSCRCGHRQRDKLCACVQLARAGSVKESVSFQQQSGRFLKLSGVSEKQPDNRCCRADHRRV